MRNHEYDEMAQVASKAPKGAIVEVGVYQGDSALRLYQVAREQNRRLYLYDTFEGVNFKDAIDVYMPGEFKNCSQHHIQSMFPEAYVVKGVFPQSAVTMVLLAFANIDCCQYRATGESIDYLMPRMTSGGIMWFPDYLRLKVVTKAVDERRGSLLPDKVHESWFGQHYVVIE